MCIRALLFVSSLLPLLASAYPITPYLEMVKVSDVSNPWKSLPLSNSYTAPVVACTYNLPSNTDNEAVIRVQVVGGNIQVKIQRPVNSSAVTASDVYCTISEEGSYTLPIKYEAHTVSSAQTNKSGDWVNTKMVNVTASKLQNYTSPVVTGQVMSYNNPNFTTFWSSNGNRGTPPTNAALYIGKHTAESTISAPTTETLGYFIAESGEYILANSHIKIALGSNKIRGVTNSPPYNYALPSSFSFATATLSGMNGSNGGWAVLYGANPVSSQLNLATEEDTVNDVERSHISEQIAYWVMEPIIKTYANIRINEVMYQQDNTIDEFIEFTVLSAGSILNYLVSSQDGTSQNFRLPDIFVNIGDFVILHSNTGTNSSSGGIHHIYTQSSLTPLANGGDEIALLKPSNTDTTTLNGSGTHNVIPVDYIAYGTGADPIPVSANGVTVSWNSADNARLGGAATGQSISLTPNAVDTDTSICWEKTTSGEASACPTFIITRDSDPSTFINSEGKNNVSAPLITLTKSVVTIYDPYNGASNPKAIPGSVLEYIISAKNDGTLAADSGSLKIADLIPGKTKLCITNTGYCKAPYLINGSPDSGLTLAGVSYSDNNGMSYIYSPTADAEGTDNSVTNLRASFGGAFVAKTGAVAPNFTLKFRVVVE